MKLNLIFIILSVYVSDSGCLYDYITALNTKIDNVIDLLRGDIFLLNLQIQYEQKLRLRLERIVNQTSNNKFLNWNEDDVGNISESFGYSLGKVYQELKEIREDTKQNGNKIQVLAQTFTEDANKSNEQRRLISSRVGTLEQQMHACQEHDKKIGKLEKQLARAMDTIEKLTNDMYGYNAELTDMQRKNTDMADGLKKVETKQNDLINSKGTVESMLSDLSREVKDTSEIIQKLEGKTEDISSAFESRIVILETEASDFETRIEKIENEVDQENETLVEIGKDVSEIKASIAKLSEKSQNKSIRCRPGYTLIAKFSRCYKIVTSALSFDNARAQCQREGSDLIMFESRDELQFFQPLVLATEGRPNCCMFVGSRSNKWLNGSALAVVPYTNGGLWEPGYTNNRFCGCIYITNNNWLANCGCTAKLFFICGHLV